jgi:hypothetical protein
MKWSNLLGILLTALSAVCFAQEVKTADNPTDGSKSVQILFHAKESYKRADGSDFTPALEIRCDEKKTGKRSLMTVLTTGGLRTVAQLERDSFASQAPGKSAGPNTTEVVGGFAVDRSNEKPAHDPKVTSDGGKSITADWVLYTDKDRIANLGSEFIKAALKTPTVRIAFPATGRARNNDVVAQFDLSGLKVELENHGECSIK